METNEFLKKLNETFDEFENYQNQIIDLINTDQNAFIENVNQFQIDINRYNESIRFLIDELVNRLKNGTISLEEGIHWNNRLKIVMDRLTIIYFEIEKMKALIKEEMNALKKNRTAIMGYHSGEKNSIISGNA